MWNVDPRLVPVSRPPPKFEVPATAVKRTPFVPPVELIAAKFALSVMLEAIIAGPPAFALVIEPVPLVTVMVPVPLASKAVPLFRVMLNELNVMLLVFTAPTQFTAVVAAPVVVALVAP